MGTYLDAYRAARGLAPPEAPPQQPAQEAANNALPELQRKAGIKPSKTDIAHAQKKVQATKTTAKKPPAQRTDAPKLEVGKQRGLYDNVGLRTKVAKWQSATAPAAVEELVSNQKQDKIEDATPRKRLVSDDHWLQQKTKANGGEPMLGSMKLEQGVHMSGDSKQAKAQAQKSRVLLIRKPDRKRVVTAPIPKVHAGQKDSAEGIKRTPSNTRAASFNQDRAILRQDKLEPRHGEKTERKQRNAIVRKSTKRQIENPIVKDTTFKVDTNAKSAQKTVTNRMEDWLAKMPDPEDHDFDMSATSTRVRDNSNRPMERYSENPASPPSEYDSSSNTTPLKRRGARRTTGPSPRSPRGGLVDLPLNRQGLMVEPTSPQLERSNPLKLKRNLTKHSDLMSVLSISGDAGEALVPADSVRATRIRSGVPRLMRQVEQDETKYAHELWTMTEGVIPVLLKCVVHGSRNATLQGILKADSNLSHAKDTIVDLGIALESLHGLHKHVPTSSAPVFVDWARRTHFAYTEYVAAWRLGFKDVIVNLARHEGYGDDLGSGERVDVTFLLKRPLVRLQQLARILKHMHLEGCEQAESVYADYNKLVLDARFKQGLEKARIEDQDAAVIDGTRARNISDLVSVTQIHVRVDRCVRARDEFDLHIDHSTGQRIDCRVVIILRDDANSSVHAAGDILICQVEETSRWLLFPPFERRNLSARRDTPGSGLVVWIRGEKDSLSELVHLNAASVETENEWLAMLGTDPVPPFSLTSRSSPQNDIGTQSRLTDTEDDEPCFDRPLGEPSVISAVESDRRQLRVKFANVLTPPQAATQSYKIKAKHNLRNFFADFQIAERRQTSLETLKPLPGEPLSPSRPLSPIFSEGSSLALRVKRPEGTTTDQSRRMWGTKSKSSHRGSEYRGKGLKAKPGTVDRTLTSLASSPLKREYDQPSDSDYLSTQEEDSTDDDSSVTSESFTDDLVPDLFPGLSRRTRSIQPGEGSADRYGVPTVKEDHEDQQRTIASLFAWSEKGVWETLHQDECSIVVSPGLIEAYEMTSAHSYDKKMTRPSPLVALELTPLVPLRQGTAIDISIRSPPLGYSSMKHAGSNIMFRSRTGTECDLLYSLINQARISNPRYVALQNARGPGPQGGAWAGFMDKRSPAAYDGRTTSSWWKLGSKKSSYRASARQPQTASIVETPSTGASMSSAIVSFKRFTSGSKVFSIARSTIFSRGANSASHSNSLTSTLNSSDESSGGLPANSADVPAGMSDLQVRIYERETSSKWRDMGQALLTIMHTTQPQDAVITSTGHLRQSKRIVVVGKTRGETLLDATLGETSFERVARTGIAVKIWEDVDQVGKTGGVAGARIRVFMIQLRSEAEAAYVFSLVGRQRY